MAKILQLKIELDEINPPIWRRLLVEDSITFQELHDTIQAAMGWGSYHMWEFHAGNETVGPEEEGFNLAEASFGLLKNLAEMQKMLEQEAVKGSQQLNLDKMNKLLGEERRKKKESKFNVDTTIGTLINSQAQRIGYLYDFGDSWEHTITVENITEENEAQTYPICIAGERACPPEDCGGVHGYSELMKIRENKAHPEYRERIVEWLGEDYDPEHFDIDEVNRALSIPSDTLVENAAAAFTDEFFQKIWKEEKDGLKGLSKKEIAEEMYYRGIVDFILENKKNLPDYPEYDEDAKR